jgi:heme/copper-type cytochrome/quinol oxidase subunit 4
MLTLDNYSDLVIALAYASIPFQLLYFIYQLRDKKPDHLTVVGLFASFIWLCSLTHLFNVIHAPRWQSASKALAALVSAATMAALLWLLPAIRQWVKDKEEMDRCVQNTQMFISSVMIPRNVSLQELLTLVQRTLDFIFQCEGAMYIMPCIGFATPESHVAVRLDWEHNLIVPERLYNENKKFFEQLKNCMTMAHPSSPSSESLPVVAPVLAPLGSTI